MLKHSVSPSKSGKISGAIFDLDGTLVDSLAATFEAFNHGIISQGGREHTPDEIMAYFGPGEGQIFAKILGQDKADAAYSAARKFMDENLHRVPFHAGIPELLESLKSAGIPISIVTGRSWNTTEIILKHHRILDRFITVIANDHVSSPKPSPEGIELALKRMKLAPEQAIYVGDSWVDMRAAKLAGTSAIAALWDRLVKRHELEQHDPHHFADAPRSVWDWIRG